VKVIKPDDTLLGKVGYASGFFICDTNQLDLGIYFLQPARSLQRAHSLMPRLALSLRLNHARSAADGFKKYTPRSISIIRMH